MPHLLPGHRRGAAPATVAAAAAGDGAPTVARADEYQDGVSAGSLVKARRCWLELAAAELLPLPQRFAFAFESPTDQMAVGLTAFLRYAHYAGFVRSTERVDGPWHVRGTTHAALQTLEGLEHLFMQLRGAGSRYESTLASLDLLPMAPCPR